MRYRIVGGEYWITVQVFVENEWVGCGEFFDSLELAREWIISQGGYLRVFEEWEG